MNTSRLVGQAAKAFLLIVITIGLLLSLAGIAQAADDDLFTDLGIDTGKQPEGYVDDGSNPYGKNTTTMNPVYELFIGSDNPNLVDPTSVGRTWGLYGNNGSLNLSPEPNTASSYQNKYDAYATAAGDFTGSGKKDIVVAIGANAISPLTNDKTAATRADAGLYMFFIEPKAGDQSQPNQVFTLYNGEIGNWYDSFSGSLNRTEEMLFDYINPIMLHNYMKIVTGDFTGDGIDEIAVYIPDNNSPRVEVYQLQYSSSSETQWWLKDKWKKIYTYQINQVHYDFGLYNGDTAPNQLDMLTGDLNYDGIDDLVICQSVQHHTSEGLIMEADGNTVLEDFFFPDNQFVALFGSKSAITFSNPINILADDEELPADNFGLALGDIDGSGRDKLLFAGVSTVDGSESGRRYDVNIVMAGWQYNPDSGKFVDMGYTLNPDGAILENSRSYPHVRADLLAVSQGPGLPDQLYYRGFLFSLEADGIIPKEESIFNQDINDLRGNVSSTYFAAFEYGAMAVDLDNDLKDEIIFSYSPVEGYDDEGPRALPTRVLVLGLDDDEDSGMDIMRLFTAEKASPNNTDRSYLLMATPDVDNDTMILTFKEHYLAYSDPKILAVLAGAPVYQELEHLDQGDGYIGESGTSWATSSGSGTGSTTSGQFSLGAYFGYSHDVTFFGATLFSIELEAEYKHTWTWETEKLSIRTETVAYETYGYTDSVALYSVPIAVYVYDAVVPTNATGTETEQQEIFINIPFSPSVTVMEVDEYDLIAKDYDGILPLIREEGILTHTQGQPDTYPRTTAGLKDALVYGGNFAMVGYGSTAQTQTISIESETTTSQSHSDEFSFKAGGGAGGFKAGITLGGAYGYGKAQITTSGSEFSGSVYSMPEEVRGYGYNYSWKIIQYWHELSGDEDRIPVVSYLVETNSATHNPIIIPQNLDIDITNSTTNSLTLTWEYPYGMGLSGFQVYRHNAITDTFEELSGGWVSYDPISSSYSFTDIGLTAGAKYTYKVQARRPTAPGASILSPEVSGWTLATTDASLSLSAYQLIAYPDKTYQITSSLTSPAAASAAIYAWEKYHNGKWQEIGVSTANLNITAPKPATAGEYRLRATQQLGAAPIITYSPTLTIEVQKRQAQIVLDINEDGSGNLVLSATLRNTASYATSPVIPAGSISFDVSYQNEQSSSYVADIEVNTISRSGTATYTLKNIPDGYYQITASYVGNNYFQSATSEQQDYLKGSSSIYVTGAEDIYYGQTLTPRFWLVEEGSNGITVTEITGTLSNGYQVVFSELQKQKANVSNFGFGVTWFRGWETVAAVAGTDYSVSGLAITPLNINADSFKYASYTSGLKPYHYQAVYTVTTPGGPQTVSHDYRVNPRVLTITANGGEIEQPSITALSAADYQITGYGGVEGFAFSQTFDTLIEPQVYNSSNNLQSWSTSTPIGQYTITAKTKSGVTEADYYTLSYVASTMFVTDVKYDVVVEAQQYNGQIVGTAELTSHPGATKVTAGSGLTFTAYPNPGYQVASWAAYVGTDTVASASQTGGNSFKCGTLANSTKVIVTFEPKDTVLTFAVQPLGSGNITAQDLTTNQPLLNSSPVMENTALELVATPEPGYSFHCWYIYQGTSSFREEQGIIDPVTGSSTLGVTMPGQKLHAEAIFVRNDYCITFSQGLNAWYYDDIDDDFTTPDELVMISSGDYVPGDKELTVALAQWQHLDEWLEYPDSAVFDPMVDTSCTYLVLADAHFAATTYTTFGLTVSQPADGSIAVYLDGTLDDTTDFAIGAPLRTGTEVELIVTADTDYLPGYWLVNGEKVSYGQTSYSYTVDSMQQISHVLLPIEPNPTISFDDTLISCATADGTPVVDGEQVAPDTILVFTALLGAEEKVVRWTAGPTAADQALLQTAGEELRFTVVAADIMVMVETATVTYQVDLQVTNAVAGNYQLSFGSGSPADAVLSGESVSLQVMPKADHAAVVDIEGATFDNIIDRSNGITEYVIQALSADITISVDFQDQRQYTVTVTPVVGGKTVASEYTTKAGSTITLTATADSGFRHDGWLVMTADQSTTITVANDNTFTMPAANVTVLASFSSTKGGGGGGGGGGSEEEKPTEVTPEPTVAATKISFSSFIDGFADNSFRGEQMMTREQFVKILYMLNAGPTYPQTGAMSPTFADVAADRWSYQAIEWADKRGIIQADEQGNFRPADILTRAEMAAMLVACYQLSETTPDTFSDILIHPQRLAILRAVKAGIFTGYPDGSFKPDNGSKRAEVVTALVRYLLQGEPSEELWQGLTLNFNDTPSSYWAYPYIALAVNGYSESD